MSARHDIQLGGAQTFSEQVAAQRFVGFGGALGGLGLRQVGQVGWSLDPVDGGKLLGAA